MSTSRDAFESIDAAAVRERVFSHILLRRNFGSTCWEAEQALNGIHQTISPRINEEGRVLDGGQRRRTGSGRWAIVWEATAPEAVETVKSRLALARNAKKERNRMVEQAAVKLGHGRVMKVLRGLIENSGPGKKCCAHHILGGQSPACN